MYTDSQQLYSIAKPVEKVKTCYELFKKRKKKNEKKF